MTGRLRDLRPSQFYISQEKLAAVQTWFTPEDLSNFDPLPVKWLDGQPTLTDGHTRAVAALLAGVEEVPLRREEDELDWELYRRCAAACRERGVLSPADLLGRILPAAEYRERWYGFCDRLQAEMETERGAKG